MGDTYFMARGGEKRRRGPPAAGIMQATNYPHGMNWGKFMLCRFDEQEWSRRSGIKECDNGRPMLPQLGWDRSNLWVLDLQTGEGALFRPGGLAVADLEKHAVWVCPMYRPFLEWLYNQDLSDITKLPDFVELPKAESAMYGYRRKGP
jgi:hypothetical protein